MRGARRRERPRHHADRRRQVALLSAARARRRRPHRVVSPLISLMHDQLEKLDAPASTPCASTRRCGLKAARAVMDGVADIDKPTLLYLTPERIVDRTFRAELKRLRPDGVDALRRRRSALHLAVGPRLPSRLSRPRRSGARPRRTLAAGAHGHRAAASARRHPRALVDAPRTRRLRRHRAPQLALQRRPRAPSTTSSRSSPSSSRACRAPASSTSRR